MKKILIISSDYTGHGHKSITESLTEQFAKFEKIKVEVIDGFSLSGNIGLGVGKLYGPVTRTSKDLWKVIWDMSLKKPYLVNDMTEFTIKERFIKLLDNLNPDAIITTHPNYNSPIVNILEEQKKNIPFYSVVADPVSISPLWADSRTHITFCPTPESREKCIEFGVPEEKIKVLGFPVRQKFCRLAADGYAAPEYHTSEPLRCLIMSGGEGSGNMSRIAKTLMKNFNCTITIVCGRNKLLKKRLELTFSEQYGDRVRIFGFVREIQELMLESDILFGRASPNTMMEAVMCNVPILITGALPGQEEGNPGYALKHNLGVVSNKASELKKIVAGLLENDARKLNSIKKAQLEFRDPYSATNIVKTIMEDMQEPEGN